MLAWHRTWPDEANDFYLRTEDGWARVYLMAGGEKWFFSAAKHSVRVNSGIRADREEACAAACEALGLSRPVLKTN